MIEQQDSATESAARSLREAEVRYKTGIDPYLNVITAQTALLSDQQAAVKFSRPANAGKHPVDQSVGRRMGRLSDSVRKGTDCPALSEMAA